MAGCSTCPDLVISVLSEDVYDTLYRIQRMREITRIFNTFFQSVSSQILQEIQALVDLIPDPPYLDLNGLINLLTCPLLPQAILVEQADALIYYVETQLKSTPILERPPLYGPTVASYSYKQAIATTTLTPQAILRRYANMAQGMLTQIERLIEEAAVATGQITGMQYSTPNPAYNANMAQQGLSQGPYVPTTVFDSSGQRSGVATTGGMTVPQFDKNKQKKFVFSPEATIAFRTARRLIREMLCVLDSADTFVVKLAVTTASVELVRVTCPGIFMNTQYPFRDYTREAAGFTFDGIVPSGLQPQAQQVARIMMTLQRKIAEWQQASFLAIN